MGELSDFDRGLLTVLWLTNPEACRTFGIPPPHLPPPPEPVTLDRPQEAAQRPAEEPSDAGHSGAQENAEPGTPRTGVTETREKV